jgi:hypothetical protein
MLVLGIGLAAAVSAPAFAQPIPKGDPSEASKGADAKDYDLRVKFDEESAKGEIMCKGGKLKGDSVEFERCAKDKVAKYDEVAIKKKIVASKEEFEKLAPKEKELAKKLAFFDSAKEKVEGRMKELGDAKKDDIEYKKLKGALKKIKKDLKSAAAESKKSGKLKYVLEEEAGKKD